MKGRKKIRGEFCFAQIGNERTGSRRRLAPGERTRETKKKPEQKAVQAK